MPMFDMSQNTAIVTVYGIYIYNDIGKKIIEQHKKKIRPIWGKKTHYSPSLILMQDND